MFVLTLDSSVVRMITLIDSSPPFSRATCQQCRIPEPSPHSQSTPTSALCPSLNLHPTLPTSTFFVLFILLHIYIPSLFLALY